MISGRVSVNLLSQKCLRHNIAHLSSNGRRDNFGSGVLDVLVAHHTGSEFTSGFRERTTRAAVQTANLY